MSSDPHSPKNDSPKPTPPSKKSLKESTEVDLWDLDTTDDDFVEKSVKPVGKLSKVPTSRINESSIRSGKPSNRPIADPQFEEPEAANTPASQVSAKSAEHEEASRPATEKDQPETGSDEAPLATSTSSAMSLSKAEKAGTIALFAILGLAAIFTLIHLSNRLETRPAVSEQLDLPIEGKLVKATAVSTFWRETITTGDNADTVKRGAKLIPVLRIKLEAKSASIRVLFRNENGDVMGDPINRSVKGKTELTIPSTDGFNDIGMHAAYRTGESPPWTVQVFESSDSAASIDKFDTLLETEISTDMR